MLLCVHCRRAFRVGETFLCLDCAADDQVRSEAMLAERMGVSYGRAWLVRERGWRGGRHDKPRQRASA